MSTQAPQATATGTVATTLLESIIPEQRFDDSIVIEVHAEPAAIFRGLYEVTLRDMPVANLLGQIRYLPGRLLGRSQTTAVTKTQSFWDGLKAGGTVVLAEEPGREVVTGGIGKFHQLLDQEPVPLTDAEAFFAFNRPEYQKLAMSFRVEPSQKPGWSRLVLQHRTQPLSKESERKFARYWVVIKPMGAFVTKQLLLAVKRRAEGAA